MKFKKWEVALIFSLFITLTYSQSAESFVAGIADNIVRLHVVANSDEKHDQDLKLKVRDKVLEKATKLLEGVDGRDNVDKILEDSLMELNEVAKKEIFDNGYDYSVETTFEEEFFPTKHYDNFALASGIYKGLKIKIENGAGENWWCVVYPSICVGYASDFDYELSKSGIDEDEKEFMENGKYKVKFKIAEIFAEIKNKFAD